MCHKGVKKEEGCHNDQVIMVTAFLFLFHILP